ncbi:uncharacterized protein SCHCODRAFT_02096981 [Schizophyllum commune H4-8]|uniref:Expressed protein n=1 Tax=Schizophyllum commune (strain H4-8 / FGSC 9210) TaxID=578458 RepID=D8QJC7_SCHCM|nr:uncharacterized protein SCHCODRAFT_02096981 [Schizophyllum commune H4-8]KAI5886384.1 hypothetical protein SCHCODRAFT_02096981 [Schizophyllum commune H4-8]
MSTAYGSTTVHDLLIEPLVHVFLDAASFDVTNIAENPEKLSHVAPVVVSHVCSRWRAMSLDTPKLWTPVVLSQSACRDGLLPAFSQRRGEGSPTDLIHCPKSIDATVSGGMVAMHSWLSDVSYRRIRTLIARYAWGASIENLRGFPPQTPAQQTMRSRARRRWLSHRGVAGSPPWEKPCQLIILRLEVPAPMPRQIRACRAHLPRRLSMNSKTSGYPAAPR